jgi:hypothetical protein
MTYSPGLAAGYSHSKLIEDLADDVFIDHAALAYTDGRWALGLMRSVLDQGTATGRDENGNPTGEFESSQTSLQLGLGLHLNGFFPENSSPRAHFRIGANLKRIQDELRQVGGVQTTATQDATATTLDVGADLSILLFRGDGVGRPRATLRVVGVLDDLLEAELEFDEPAQSDPLHRYAHAGAALEFAFLQHPRLGPLASLTLQYEESRSRLPADETKIGRSGIELSFAQLASIRVGYLDDPEGEIQSPTVGCGLRLGWLGLPAALRLDYASRPQASGLSRVDVYSVQGSWDFGD